MAINTIISGYASLGKDLNKQKGEVTPENIQGVISDKQPELTFEMADDEIIKLTDKWESKWKTSSAKEDWDKRTEENENYWLGKQEDRPKADKSRPSVDNLVFESLETYLPQITRRNPEPLVTLDNSEQESPEALDFVDILKKRLGDLSDKNKIRLKLKKIARHWAIYELGVAKFSWDLERDEFNVRVIRPKKIILDPEATVDEDGYTGAYVGEYRKLTASKILSTIGDDPEQLDEQGNVITQGNSNARTAITDLVNSELGTEIQFIEWWTPQYICWVLSKTVLMKKKNPNWNYDQKIPGPEVVDDYGDVKSGATQEIKGVNHFITQQMPYLFLSIFNLGDQPMDKTSLINQNLSNQDLINKRNNQIDKNADRMNGGMVVSLERSGLTQSQAKSVSESLRKGGVVAIPAGSPREAIDDYAPTPLPSDVYGQLTDTRERLRDIFGTRGSSTAGLSSEQTVRGKIISRTLDTDRIGGGVSEYLEQFADDIYNWFVQFLYVYDPQYNTGQPMPKVVVSVKEGSLLPKDSTSIANQAIELATQGKMSLIDLYKRLDYPNPEELAANVWLEANAPDILYKNNQLVQEAIAKQQQEAAMAGLPAETPTEAPTTTVPEESPAVPAVPETESLLSEVPIE